MLPFLPIPPVLPQHVGVLTGRPKWKEVFVCAAANEMAFIFTFFTRVCTYVQRGSMFCFVVVVLVLVLVLVLLFVLVLADTLLRILHYCPISPCFQHITPLHAPLPGSLARQPCPAALPGSIARQPCPAALPGSSAF
jgi:hypothetical protein